MTDLRITAGPFNFEARFETGLARTVDWYLARRDWWGPIRASTYEGERLGLRS